MKKRSSESPPSTAVNGDQTRDRKSQAAIETVFRLTHKREMNDAERKMFGINLRVNRDGDGSAQS